MIKHGLSCLIHYFSFVKEGYFCSNYSGLLLYRYMALTLSVQIFPSRLASRSGSEKVAN